MIRLLYKGFFDAGWRFLGVVKGTPLVLGLFSGGGQEHSQQRCTLEVHFLFFSFFCDSGV
jgi:hypothetical protein